MTMIILTIAVLYLFSSLASTSEGALAQTDISGQLAAANGNLTALKTQIAHGLAAGPAYRGTFDIVWSCLLTILACIYNAIHLNVPPRNTGKWMLLLRKVKWATIALFAPEIVLYTATTQALDAYKVKKEVNAMRGQIRGKNKPKLIDLRYGFYVTMGGFVYDVENLHGDLSLVTLTPRGIIALARQGQFVDISTEDLTDKSKADVFTKSLICIQVSWMVIQCIARKAAGYPLTLLEIHTMVHVVCALTIYVLWWKKPYDIIKPTIIYAANYANYIGTVALMIMGSKFFWWRPEADILFIDVQASLDNDVKNLAVSGQETSVADTDEKTIQVLGEAKPFGDLGNHHHHLKHDQEEMSPKPVLPPQTVCQLGRGQYLPCGIGIRADINLQFEYMYSSDIRRWELGASAIVEILKSTPTREYNLADTRNVINLADFLHQYEFDEDFCEHIRNFPAEMLSTLGEHFGFDESPLKVTGVLFLYLLRFFIPLTAAYGGIHLSAWNFEFPSRIESIIWRTACFIIMGSSFSLLALPSFFGITAFGLSLPFRVKSVWDILLEFIVYGFFSLLLLCYPAARLYLVVESFISLRHVPIGVYAAVPWVQNIPHV